MEYQELVLRAHVRDLLLDYCLAHLTTNYVTFSQAAVSELLSPRLHVIPTKEPGSLALSVDPFDTLSARFKLQNLEPYDQVWRTDSESVQLMRKVLVLRGVPKTQRVWDEDDVLSPEDPHRPMSPILTRSSIRKTPKLGKENAKDKKKRHHDNFGLDTWPRSMKTVVNECVDETPPVSLDEALELKLGIDPSDHSAIEAFIEATPYTSRQHSATAHLHSSRVQLFLRADTPPREFIRAMSPPLFPRGRRLGNVDHAASQGMQTMADIPKSVPKIKVEEESLDLANENMIVVNGWSALAYPASQSSLDTPSLATSSSQVDELDEDFWLPSSPGKELLGAVCFENAKMDDFLISRSERVDGADFRASNNPKPSMIAETQSLSSFISLLLPKTNQAIVTTPPRDDGARPGRLLSPEIAFSMVGQPPSSPEVKSDEQSTEDTTTDGERGSEFDRIMQRVYGPLKGEDPKGLIMKERLEEKEGMLMIVPAMPPPNLHKTDEFLPTDLASLVDHPRRYEPSLPAAGEDQAILPSFATKKVTGIKSLNIELTWRPFNFGRKMPTHNEILGVSWLPSDEAPSDPDAPERRHLASLLTAHSPAPSPGFLQMKSFDSDHASHNLAVESEYADSDLILTRAERRRLAGQGHEVDETTGNSTSDDEGQSQSCDALDDGTHTDEMPAKRARMRSPSPIISYSEQYLSYRQQPNKSEDKTMTDGYHFTDEHDKKACWTKTQGDFSSPNSHFPLILDDYEDQSTFVSTAENERYYDNQAFMLDLEDHLSTDAMANLNDFAHGSHHMDAQPSESSLIMNLPNNDVVSEPSLPMHNGVRPALHPEPSTELVLPPTSSTLLSDRLCLTAYLEMKMQRNTAASNNPSAPPILEPMVVTTPNEPGCTSPPPCIPPDMIFDQNTLVLPEPWATPSTRHRYLASLDMIQKRALVRRLESPSCVVQLVERDHLSGVDIIVDPYSGIQFLSLAALPSQCDALLAQLCSLSWRFSRLLVIFEAFPRSQLYRSEKNLHPLYGYSPPVLKAINRLRRDLGLHDGLGDKSAHCTVYVAFANSVDEAAMFTRLFGTCTSEDSYRERYSENGAWIGDEELDGEGELAVMTGMNAFAASVILSCCELQELLDMSPEQRVQAFAPLVGSSVIEHFNSVLESRMRSMNITSPDFSDSLDSVLSL